MQFVNSWFLFGLLAVVVPVIIHLFNFRKFKRVWFTNVRFIKEISLQTRKQSRLKHLIILCLRILTIAALSMAFAQPYLPLSGQQSTAAVHAVSIYTDNSFSMEAQAAQGQLIDEARLKAREIAAAYAGSDRFQLLTNDFEGIHQRLVNKEEFSEMLDQVVVSPVSRKLSEVYLRQADLLAQQASAKRTIYMISDFQRPVTDLAAFPYDSNLQIYLVPLKANPTPNIYIDSCWFASPVHQAGRNVKLLARIRNASDQDVEKVPLRLSINKVQKAVSSFSLPARGEIEIALTYNDMEAGLRYGMLELTDNPVVYDDRFYFAYRVSSRIPVLSIYDELPNVYLQSLYGKDSSFTYVTSQERALDYASFSNYDLIILEGPASVSSGLALELKRFTEEGGSLLILPPAAADRTSWSSFLSAMRLPSLGELRTQKQRVGRINLDHPVYRDVFDHIPENIDLPAVQMCYTLSQGARSGLEDLLILQNGSTFLGVTSVGSGKAYLLASPLDPQATSFPQHAIFVPTLYKIALLSRQSDELYQIIGQNERIEYPGRAPGKDETFRIRSLNGAGEFIPRQSTLDGRTGIYVENQVKEAGHYALSYGDEDLQGLAFNYSRNESAPEVCSAMELKEMAERAGLKNVHVFDQQERNLTGVIRDLNMGIRLWKVFIILALVFLAAEVALLRFWK